MEFAYLVCVGGISLGTMGVFQYLYASATGGPDERLWGIAQSTSGLLWPRASRSHRHRWLT